MIKATAQPDALLSWMDALADANRLRIMRALELHELGVVELCDVLQMPQSTVSRHLKVLLEQKLLKSRRQGTNHLYQMILDELPPPARQLWIVAREQTESWATIAQDHLRVTRVLAKRENDSQTFFAGAAGEWDRIRNDLYGHRFDLAAMLALLPSDYTIADLGCGAGELACEMAGHVKNVIGVDNSDDMLQAARKRASRIKNIDLRKGELTHLPIRDAEVDAAIMILALTYTTDPSRAITEMARIIKPGRKIVLIDLLKHDRDDFRRQLGQKHPGFETQNIEQMMTAAGLHNIEVRPIPPDENANGPALFVAKANLRV